MAERSWILRERFRLWRGKPPRRRPSHSASYGQRDDGEPEISTATVGGFEEQRDGKREVSWDIACRIVPLMSPTQHPVWPGHPGREIPPKPNPNLNPWVIILSQHARVSLGFYCLLFYLGTTFKFPLGGSVTFSKPQCTENGAENWGLDPKNMHLQIEICARNLIREARLYLQHFLPPSRTRLPTGSRTIQPISWSDALLRFGRCARECSQKYSSG